MASSTKLAVVVGATGNQGGSVITALLKDGGYKVRGITRSVSSAKSAALTARGVEMVAADISSESALVAAFAGATHAFAVTDFFAPFMTESIEATIEIEYAQGANIVKALQQTHTLQHFVWSTLPDARKISGGEHVVPHFDGKARVDDLIRQDKELLAKTTFLWTSFYSSNMFEPPLTPNLLKSAGKYVWTIPAPANTPIYHAGDISANLGVFAGAIFAQPELTQGGKYVLMAASTSTLGDTIELWGEISGKGEVQYVQVSLAACEGLWSKWGKDIGLMFAFWGAFGLKSYSTVDGAAVLSAEDIGVDVKKLVHVDEAWKKTDWSSI